MGIILPIFWRNKPRLKMLLNPSSYCWPHNRPINRETGWGRNSGFIGKAHRHRRGWTRVPKKHLTRVRIRASFILKGEGVWLFASNFLVPPDPDLCSCSFPRRSSHCVPVNFQQDKCYSLLCNFLSLCE